MKTEFAKAIEAGEDVVGKAIVCINDDGWFGRFEEGEMLVVYDVKGGRVQFTNNTFAPDSHVNDFEFKHVLDKQKESEPVVRFPDYNHSAVLAQYYDKIMSLKEQRDNAVEINKQYEQQIQMLKDDLFNLQMENARLDLAAQRWEMFDCEANRNIADKLLKKLADEQGE